MCGSGVAVDPQTAITSDFPHPLNFHQAPEVLPRPDQIHAACKYLRRLGNQGMVAGAWGDGSKDSPPPPRESILPRPPGRRRTQEGSSGVGTLWPGSAWRVRAKSCLGGIMAPNYGAGWLRSPDLHGTLFLSVQRGSFFTPRCLKEGFIYLLVGGGGEDISNN